MSLRSIERGVFFLREHPATASSWHLERVKALEAHPGVCVCVVTGICADENEGKR